MNTLAKPVISVLLGVLFCGCDSNPLDATPQNIQFSGQIKIKDGPPQNDRLVALLLGGVEVGRAVTQRTEYPDQEVKKQKGKVAKSDGIEDGIFKIECKNDYKLSPARLKADCALDSGIFTFSRTPKSWSEYPEYDVLSAGWHTLIEGDKTSIVLRSKHNAYVLLSVAGMHSALPLALQTKNSLRMTPSGIVYCVDSKGEPTETLKGNAIAKRVVRDPEAEFVVIRRLTIPLDNSLGSATLTQEYREVQTFINEYTTQNGFKVGGNIPLISWLSVVLELERSYGSKNGQVKSQLFTTTMKAPPKSKVVYEIVYYETWDKGYVEFGADERIEKVPFKFRRDVVWEVKASSREVVGPK